MGGASLFVGSSVNVAVFRGQLHLCVFRQFLWYGRGLLLEVVTMNSGVGFGKCGFGGGRF